MGEIRTAAQRQREKIQSGMIIKRLSDHVQGLNDMSPSQVQAARILLNKTLPDVKSMELQATIEPLGKSMHQLTDEELMTIAAGGVVTRLPENKNPVIEISAIELPKKQTG